MKVLDFSKIFFAILFLHLVVIYKQESEILYLISKPLLLFSLLAFFIHKTAGFEVRGKSWIPAALLMSMVGDILMLKGTESLFIAGIGVFAVAHIFYISFYLNQKLHTNYLLLLVAALLVAAGFFVLKNYVAFSDGLSFYLYAYMGLTGLHLLVSVRLLSLGGDYAKWPALGALLFIISYILLGYVYFNDGDKYWQIVAMLFYGLAQYLITVGLIRYLENKATAIERPST